MEDCRAVARQQENQDACRLLLHHRASQFGSRSVHKPETRLMLAAYLYVPSFVPSRKLALYRNPEVCYAYLTEGFIPCERRLIRKAFGATSTKPFTSQNRLLKLCVEPRALLHAPGLSTTANKAPVGVAPIDPQASCESFM